MCVRLCVWVVLVRCADSAAFCVSVGQKVRLARIRMAKKGTTNAFLQYKEDRGLGVRDAQQTHSQVYLLIKQEDLKEQKQVDRLK